jgi:4-amino-4-deoxy-L-arabinose transferase-like glycosyltransferase
MPEPQEHQEHAAIHLPEPSFTPIVLAIGIALILFGLVPDARLYRLACVSIGVIVALIAGVQWYRAAKREYQHLS